MYNKLTPALHVCIQVSRIYPQETFYPTLLHIGSDSEDSEYSETESGDMHEVDTGRDRTWQDQHGPGNSIIAPVITAPALVIPNQSQNDLHSYSIHLLSTQSQVLCYARYCN